MTSTTHNNGRLGNQIIRNLAVSLIAKKHNLKVNYSNHDLINKLGINLFSESNIYTNMYDLNDDNYFSIYNYNNLNYNLNPNNAYFQTKEITNFIYNYLHTDSVKLNIIEKNPFKMRYNNNNDLFIHIRLADVKDKNPGINYYVNTIKQVIFDKYDKYDKMYISTDERNHNIITTLLQLYPNAILINYDEIGTFQFASTCKNIILSHGSFSAIIGYLSFFSNIYYPEYEYDKIWYGDMFSIKKFIKMPVK